MTLSARSRMLPRFDIIWSDSDGDVVTSFQTSLVIDDAFSIVAGSRLGQQLQQPIKYMLEFGWSCTAHDMHASWTTISTVIIIITIILFLKKCLRKTRQKTKIAVQLNRTERHNAITTARESKLLLHTLVVI